MDLTASSETRPQPVVGRTDWLRLTMAALLGLALLAVMPVSNLIAARNDFVHFYVGGLLYGTPEIHQEAANQKKQVELIGAVFDHSFFIRPTFYGFFLKPLTVLPYKAAYWVFQLVSVCCVLVFLRAYSPRMPDLPAFVLISVPLIANFVNGQDVTLLLLFCTVSLLLASKGHDFAAGLVFSLCAIKFHLFVLTPLAMIANRRWRLLWGAVAGEVALFLIGLMGGGWQVFLSLVSLLSKTDHHPYPGVMPNLRGLDYALTGGSPILFATLVVVVGAASVWLVVKAPTYEMSFAFSLMGGLLLNFHEYIQDPSLLLLCAPLLLNGAESKAFRIGFQFLLAPPAFILLLWRPPFSGMFAACLIVVILIAIRDLWSPVGYPSMWFGRWGRRFGVPAA